MMEKLLNTAQASLRLEEITGQKFPVPTLNLWRFQRRGPRVLRVEGRVFYRESDLIDFLKSRVVEPATAEIDI